LHYLCSPFGSVFLEAASPLKGQQEETNKNKLFHRERFNSHTRSLDKQNHCEVEIMIQTKMPSY